MPGKIVLSSATLIGGTGRDPRSAMAVVVEGEHIVRVARADAVALPPDAQVIACPPPCSRSASRRSSKRRWTRALPRSATRAVSMVGGPMPSRLACCVARILPSGSMLSQTAGHGDWRPRFSAEPLPKSVPGLFAFPELCDGPDAVRQAAREQLRRGATQIKVMASGGAMSPADELDHTQFTPAEIAAAVHEAEAAGTYALAHAYGPRAIASALEAGVRSIEHGNFIDEATAAAIKARGAWFVPTLATYEMIDIHGEAQGVPEENLRKIREARARGDESLRIAEAAGLAIGSGSDLLAAAQPFKARELTLKAGVLGSMAAIVSATRTNAQLFATEGRFGTVEGGKQGDLIAVAGNPLDDIALLEDPTNVSLVVKQGVIMKDIR